MKKNPTLFYQMRQEMFLGRGNFGGSVGKGKQKNFILGLIKSKFAAISQMNVTASR
jgi:hypothetical protein